MKAFLESLRRAFGGPTELDQPRPLEQLILLILARGTDLRKAETVMKRLQSHYVDWNEVRVTSAYELRKLMHGLPESKFGDRADQIKELLSTIYNRFNKLNLDFLQPGSTDAESVRKRERFMAWLQERSPSLAAVMSLYGSSPGEVVSNPSLARLLQRLGWLNGKSTGAAAIREALLKRIPEADRVSGQWALHHLIELYCLGRNPTCPDCPAVKHCPTGKKAVRAGAAAGKGQSSERRRSKGREPAASRKK